MKNYVRLHCGFEVSETLTEKVKEYLRRKEEKIDARI